jgi:hypothetical protein
MEGGEGGVMDKDLKDAVEVARYLVSQYKEHTKVYFVASALIRAATQRPEVVTESFVRNEHIKHVQCYGDINLFTWQRLRFPHGLKIVEG